MKRNKRHDKQQMAPSGPVQDVPGAGPAPPGQSTQGPDVAASETTEDADDYIQILEVTAADEAGVRLPDGKARGHRDEDGDEIDVDLGMDSLESGASASPFKPTGSAADVLAARTEAGELREQLLRTAADFDNFRKRVERDRVEERKQATAGLVRNILPVLDSLRRALSQAERSDEAGVKGFLDGLRLIETQLFDILKSAGLEPVDASGIFDPTFHEALMQETTSDAPHMTVLEVFEPGYRLGGRLLRPARVKVANNPSTAAGEGTDTDTTA